MTDEQYAALQEIGKSAAQSLAEMVAALECDYDRLEELRNERQAFNERSGTAETLPMPDDEELAELEAAAGGCTSREDALQRIKEDPLSVQVRDGWHDVGDTSYPEEFEILLGTGGPATRILGELDEHNEPKRARLQTQDWFTPWTDYRGDAISQDDLLTYCRCFYFGE